jgi:hypothetical protein
MKLPQFAVRLLCRLIPKAKETPYYHLPGYMNRDWLIPYVEGGSEADIPSCGPLSWRRRPFSRLLQCFGVAVRIHTILRSDRDRALHDHPFDYMSIILTGGYSEVTESGSRWYGPGAVIFRRATSRHRLDLRLNEMFEGPATTTLFITMRRGRQKWGFFPDDIGGVKVPPDLYDRET